MASRPGVHCGEPRLQNLIWMIVFEGFETSVSSGYRILG